MGRGSMRGGRAPAWPWARARRPPSPPTQDDVACVRSGAFASGCELVFVRAPLIPMRGPAVTRLGAPAVARAARSGKYAVSARIRQARSADGQMGGPRAPGDPTPRLHIAISASVSLTDLARTGDARHGRFTSKDECRNTGCSVLLADPRNTFVPRAVGQPPSATAAAHGSAHASAAP